MTGRVSQVLAGVVSIVIAVTSLTAIESVLTDAPASAAPVATAPATPNDVAIDGIGQSDGYHVRVARAASGYSWVDIATIKPAGLDESNWFGEQCISSDGKYAAVAVLPGSAENITILRGAGAYAYAVNLATGAVTPLATGVGDFYFSPSCGTDESATFTSSVGLQQETTELNRYNLATGDLVTNAVVRGQVTSAVGVGTSIFGALAGNIVKIAAGGSVDKPKKPTTVAKIGDAPYGLTAASDGGVDFLTHDAKNQTSHVWHLRGASSHQIGNGQTQQLRLFGGRSGHNLITGYQTLNTGSGLQGVAPAHLGGPPTVVSLDAGAAFGPLQAAAAPPGSNAATTGSDVAALESLATHTLSHSHFVSGGGAKSTHKTGSELDGTQGDPQAEASTTVPDGPKVSTGPLTHVAAASFVPAMNVVPATSPGATTPTCAVPRNDPTLQAMQPGNAQISWAIEMAEQGFLTGASSTRPANFANMGLASYSPSSDFPPIALSHPSSDTWSKVPRSVMEAIAAQESNYNQASWHALPGIAGNPLIADYYGAGGTITTINYPAADCGYGVVQVTTGMHVSDSGITANGKKKVAVDYQENIAAGLQILEKTWNQLYTSGITVNGGDPRYLENWYFAVWAYNSGIQPTAAFGNTTGCTPSPTCTGPDGTWGLGWSNNPANPSYNPARAPYLFTSYADAEHPSSWPYEERIMGWMSSPLVRFGFTAYTPADFHNSTGWMMTAPTTQFCETYMHCNPVTSTCGLADSECWWHTSTTWIPSCSTQCSTSSYTASAGSTEPTYTPPASRPVTKTCSIDTSYVPPGSIIVDDLASPGQNLQGCSGSAWTNGGTFTLTPGQNGSGDPIGSIDIHQLGAGLGGHMYFTHTESAASTSLINTGKWSPTLPSSQNYKIMVHIPASGAVATDVIYAVNPSGGGTVTNVRVNQNWGREQWITLGTFGMNPGGTLTLTNASNMTPGTYDVAYDAVAFIPKGGTPNIPIGGAPRLIDAPAGANPAWVECGCGTVEKGDPVDTGTGYFGQSAVDISTPGRGLPFRVSRTYSAALADPSGPAGANAVSGAFGPGWTYSYGMTATTAGGSGNVTILQEDGSRVTFTLSGGVYTPELPRFNATLTKSGSVYTYSRRGTEFFQFDFATGHLTNMYDQAGWVATPKYGDVLAYDAGGKLHTVTDPGGRVYTFTFTGSTITKITTSAGQEIDYVYTSGQLTDVYGIGTQRPGGVNGNQDRSQYSYGAHNLMSSFRTPANYGKTGTPTPVTSMIYDSSERVTSQTDPTGATTTFVYGPDTPNSLVAGQTLVTDGAGHKELETFTGGLLTARTKGYGTTSAQTWTYAYDPLTLGITKQTNPDGGVLTFAYDDAGNVAASVDALGRATGSVYDSSGHLLVRTTPDLVQSVMTYNAAGAQTSLAVSRPGQSAESTDSNPPPDIIRTSSTTYPDAAHPGDPSVTKDFNGNATTLTFDAIGDLLSSQDAAGHLTKFGWDTTRGLLTSTVSPRGVAAGTTVACTPPAVGCTTYAHDAWGRVTATVDAMGHTVSSTFDADGDVLTVTDPNSHVTTTTYDNDDRPLTVAKPSGTLTSVYNNDGTIHTVTDLGGHVTTYGYDSHGRVSTTTDADSKVTTYTYDPNGRVNSITDPNGTTATSVFDKAGQLTGVTYTGTLAAPAVTFTYDLGGRRLTMTDGTGTSTYSYDTFGELVSQKNGAGSTVGYGYDAQGNQTTITYPGTGNSVVRTFNTLNQLAAVADSAARSTSFTYDADGRETLITYPNGTKDTIGYNDSSLVTSVALSAGATALDTFTYGRDNVGNQTSSTPSNGAAGSATTFGYDANNQVTSSVVGSTTTSNAFDAAANPTKVGGTNQVFDNADRLCWTTTTAVSSPTCGSPVAGADVYTSDSDGERTVKTPGTGASTNYTWNGAGALTAVGGTASVSYGYNGDGLRTSKTVSATTTNYTWGASRGAPELLTDGTQYYIYGPNDQPIEQTSTGAASPTWYFANAQGSTAALTDAAGAVTGRYAYSVWGATTSHTGAATTPLQFDGQYTDSETGLIYLRARYYDPTTALFLSVDAAISSTHMAFAFASNNPLLMSDPMGLDDWWNPFSWSGQTWAVIGTVALVAGGIALAATGVGLVADIAIAATATAIEAGTATAAVVTVAEVAGVTSEVAGGIATGAGAVGSVADAAMCVGQNDGPSCAGAIMGGIGAGWGAGAIRYGQQGLHAFAIASDAHALVTGGIGYAVDRSNYDAAQEEDFEHDCDEFEKNLLK